MDMMEGGVCGSSKSLTRVTTLLREICGKAVRRLERRREMRTGGRRAFVAIDESKFRHKRKVSVLYSTVHFHYYDTINTVATGFNGVKGIVHTELLYIIIYKRLDSLQVSLINLHDDGNTALHMSI